MRLDGWALLLARAVWGVLYFPLVAILVVALVAGAADLTADVEIGLLRPHGGTYATAFFALEVGVFLWYVANSILMAWKASHDVVALYSSVGAMPLASFLFPEMERLAADPQLGGAAVVAQWLSPVMVVPFLLFFPDGRFVPRRSWLVVPIWITFWSLTALLMPGGEGIFTLSPVRLVVWMVVVSAGFATQVFRLRTASDPIARQQIKWALFGCFTPFAAALLIQPARFIEGDLPRLLRSDIVLPLLILSNAGITGAFTLAMLKYRLWQIDVIINRAIVYGTVTAILAGLYAASLAFFERLFTATVGSSDGAFIVSLFVLGALFAPIKDRVHRTVDRRFKPVVERPTRAEPSDRYALLRQLGELRGQGIISEDEFVSEKAKILID